MCSVRLLERVREGERERGRKRKESFVPVGTQVHLFSSSFPYIIVYRKICTKKYSYHQMFGSVKDSDRNFYWLIFYQPCFDHDLHQPYVTFVTYIRIHDPSSKDKSPRNPTHSTWWLIEWQIDRIHKTMWHSKVFLFIMKRENET